MKENKQRNINIRRKIRLNKERITDILMIVMLAAAIMLLALIL